MNKTIGYLCVGSLCAASFLVFKLRPNASSPLIREPHKPSIPSPASLRREHPWLQLQPLVQEAHLEILRDLDILQELSAHVPAMTEEEITLALIETLLPLQAQIPFSFPETLYNVLCIPASNLDVPFPFKVYKRLYLGETELGLPFYLDVRVFELDACSQEEIIAWHLNLLEGEQKQLLVSENRSVYLVMGERGVTSIDSTHGFAKLQGKRGMFLDFIQQDGCLFVAYAEAPLYTFEQKQALFQELSQL